MGHLEHENVSIFISHSPIVRPHEHDFLELAYVSYGSAEHIIGNSKVKIGVGDYFFIDYNTVHSYESTSGSAIEVVNCLFKPRFIDNSLTYCRSFRLLLNHYLIKVKTETLRISPVDTMFHDDDGSVGSYFGTLVREYNEKQPGFSEMMRCTLIEVILTTVRRIATTDFGDDAIRFLTDYVSENYRKPLSLSVLARQVGYSLPYLSERFKQTMGSGFKEYLIKIRIDEACRLLANTDKKIVDIAADVGYTDVNFFYSVFRRITGQSPREFRSQLQ